MKYLPHEIDNILKTVFNFPNSFLFGTVASVEGSAPKLRTMRIYALDAAGCPILLTHTQSAKWKEFQNNTHICICFLNENKTFQILLRGKVILETSSEHRQEYWNLVRSDVKKIYDSRYVLNAPYQPLGPLTILKEPPETFGIAKVMPSFWEVIEFKADYVESPRYQFSINQGDWEKQRIHVG